MRVVDDKIPCVFSGYCGGVQGGLLAPMPGRIIALLAAAGTLVEKGAPLLILEAMKMEHTISAPAAGLVKAHRFAVGDQITDGVELVDFEPTSLGFAPITLGASCFLSDGR